MEDVVKGLKKEFKVAVQEDIAAMNRELFYGTIIGAGMNAEETKLAAHACACGALEGATEDTLPPMMALKDINKAKLALAQMEGELPKDEFMQALRELTDAEEGILGYWAERKRLAKGVTNRDIVTVSPQDCTRRAAQPMRYAKKKA